MTPTKGIVDRIREAKTASEVDELLRELKGYEHASQKTVRRALKVAEQRKARIGK